MLRSGLCTPRALCAHPEALEMWENVVGDVLGLHRFASAPASASPFGTAAGLPTAAAAGRALAPCGGGGGGVCGGGDAVDVLAVWSIAAAA